jgi:hypothetical protein
MLNAINLLTKFSLFISSKRNKAIVITFYGATTLNVTAFSIMTLSITAFSIITLSSIQYNDTEQHSV